MSDWLEARSEYLQYLPQVFRGGGGDGAGEREFLPDLLLAFQKILTGVRAEDGFEDKTRITSTHDRPDYEPLESIIDQLDRFFDPFRTDPEFLDWLASWVALELRPDWTHAEKRKMIARMVRVVKRVGLKSGLYDFLDIYAKEQVRPRIVIDDDEALFRIVLNDDGSTSVNVLAYASLEAWGGRQVPFLYRPTAIAVNPHADPAQVRYLVADAGRAGRKYPPEIQPSLWLLQPNGEPDNLHWSGTGTPTDSPYPSPINIEEVGGGSAEAKQLSAPAAVAFHPANSDYLVLEKGESFDGGIKVFPSILRYPAGQITSKSGDGGRSVLIDLAKAFGASGEKDKPSPVDMVVDPAARPKRLIVLDRPGSGPCLRIVPLEGENPALVTIPLDRGVVVDPTAIAWEEADTFVIADARDSSDNGPRPGTLIRVKIDVAKKEATQVDLLQGLDVVRNPLVYPTGLVVLKPGHFLVCDTGVKSEYDTHPAFRTMAEPAAVVRVEVEPDAKQTTFTALTRRGVLSWPSRIVRDESADAVLVTDTGELDILSKEATASEGVARKVPWRGQANRFAVSVLYSKQKLDPSIFAEDDDTKEQAENRRKAIDLLNNANHGIQMVIEQKKPLHATQVWHIPQ